MQKFLIINPFGIGDVLFTTPIIRAIKENYPESFIGYWCNGRVKDIFENNPYLDKVFALSRGDLKKVWRQSRLKGIKAFLKLFYDIKREHFNLALDFSLDHRYSLLLRLLGVKRIIGLDYKKRGRFLTDKIKIDGYNDKHVIEYYLDLLKSLNIEIKDKPNIELFISNEEEKWVDDFLKEHRITDEDLLIGIAPAGGESWGKDAWLKHWPVVKFAHLADRIIDNYGANVIILGDKQERDIANKMINIMRNKPIDLTGKTNLEEFIAIIKDLSLLITNDGGPLHIAVALGVKTVSIFGPVDEKVYGPYPPGLNHIVIKKDLACRPCYRNFRFRDCANQRRCLEDITVDEVYSAVKKLTNLNYGL